MQLSRRVINCLRAEFGFTGEILPHAIAAFSERDLYRSPNFGKKSMEEVKAWLLYNGMVLAEHPHPKNAEAIYITFLRSKGYTVIRDPQILPPIKGL